MKQHVAVEYIEALLLVIPNAPALVLPTFGSPACWDFEFVTWQPQTSERSAIDFGSCLYLRILDSETHTVRAPCWNWHQVVPFLSFHRTGSQVEHMAFACDAFVVDTVLGCLK